MEDFVKKNIGWLQGVTHIGVPALFDGLFQEPVRCLPDVIRLDVDEERSTVHKDSVVADASVTRRLDEFRPHVLVGKAILLFLPRTDPQNIS